MATPTQVQRKGHDLAFIIDGNQGNPTLAVRDKAIGAGHTAEVSGDTTNVKWGVVGEPLTFARTFRKRKPQKRRFAINVPINGSVDSSEGVVAFNCPTDRAFKVIRVTETHQVLEATAGMCNLQVAIVPDVIAINGAGVRKCCTPNEIDVETEGVAVNVTTEARLEKGTPARVVGSQYLITTTTSDDGQVLWNVPVGRSYKLINATVQFTTVPAATDAVPIAIKKLAATDVAATIGSGTEMATVDLSPSGTELADETVHTLVLSTTNANILIAAGERLAYEINAGGTPAAGADMLLSWILEETTSGITGAAGLVVHPGERVMVYFEQDDGLTVQDTTEYRGHVTVTLEEVEAEAHQERIISTDFSDQDNLATTGLCVFEASEHRWRVKSIEESHAVVDGGTTVNCKVERCQGTEAATSGDDLVTATGLNLKATINTVQTAVIITTGNRDILEEGDRLVVHAANDAASAVALGTYDGVVTIVVAPELGQATSPLKVVSQPLEKAILVTGSDLFIADQAYRLVGVSLTPVIIETTVAAPSIQLEKLSDGQAVAGGTLLLAAQALDADATVDTIQHVTPVAADAIIAKGQRIALYGTDDGASDAAVALTEFRGGITLFLLPLNDVERVLGTQGDLFTNKTGRPVELRGAFASWDEPETTAETLNLILERLTVNEVGGAGNGDRLCGLTDINVKGSDDTGDSITPVTTIAIQAGTLTTGSGLNDVTSGGTFTAPPGFLGRTVFTFTVDSTGTTDTFTVRRDGVVLARKQDFATAAITIRGGDGITILWAAITGHTLNDVWTVVVSRNTILEDGDRLGFYFDLDAGGTVTVPVELEGLTIVPQLVPTQLAEASTT